jgi:hypothetical protein
MVAKVSPHCAIGPLSSRQRTAIIGYQNRNVELQHATDDHPGESKGDLREIEKVV